MKQGITPATTKTYLVAIRHAQVVQGHLEPQQSSTLPRLCLVQNGVRRHAGSSSSVRLPITAALVRQMGAVSQGSRTVYDSVMGWAAATTCFFGLFQAGELTVPAASAFLAAVYLSWGDVAVCLRRSRTLCMYF